MSQVDTTFNNLTSSSGNPQTNQKYWCFVCEKEFCQQRYQSAEVYCPQCNCISELIETEDDPRNFKPYDAQRENPQPNGDSTSQNVRLANNTIQGNLGPQGQSRVFLQRTLPTSRLVFQPVRSLSQLNSTQSSVPQNDPASLMQARRNARAQLNQDPNQQEQPQRPQIISIEGNMLNPLLMNPLSILNSLSFGVPIQAVIFGDLEDRIIEEFLRNDPNRYGPPPAPEESINKLKEVVYKEETCKVKDCSVCQEDYKDGENLLIMPCEHTFHKDCLNTWLRMHNSCPVCRKSLEDSGETDA